MARLQILELPSGINDERPPFALIVDQATEATARALDIVGRSTAELFQARTVLVFEETVTIPANDTSAYRDQVTEEIKYASGEITREPEGPRLASERTDIARDMGRLAKRKHELLDALGMDPTRDWDDIRNAAAGIRKARETQASELERLHAGEEPVTDERITPTPGQWIWHFNRATPEKRLDMAAQILDSMPTARNCFMADHEAQIKSLRDEVDRLRPQTPDA